MFNLNKENSSQLNKALLVCIFFLLFFTLIPGQWQWVGDFNFHFEKAKQSCAKDYPQESCDGYYPLLHLLSSNFSFSIHAFSSFLMVLLVFVTPMIIFLITKHWFSVWLYFSATQYVYLIQAGGAYPQALAGIFLLLFFLVKNNWLRAGILVLAILSHSQAFLLLLSIWFVLLFFENFKSYTNFLPACSGLFGKQAVDPIGQQIEIGLPSKLSGPVMVNLKDIANFFVRTFPLPFLLAAFWQLKKERDYALILISLVIVYYGIAMGQARIFLVIPLILLPSLTRFYLSLDGWWKKGFIALSIITFAINFGTWLLYKINCIST